MDLSTIFVLCINETGESIEEEETVRIELNTGEIFIGDYMESDNVRLTIERNCCDIVIEFEEIKSIEKVVK